jgi:hypothetical protein
MEFKLRFPSCEVAAWAQRYRFPGEDRLLTEVVPAIREKKFLTKAELLVVGRWKSPRIVRHLEKNSEDLIREVTGASLSATGEILRIGTLTLLQGVGWPVASAILHLCHTDPYPILDFRALWSLECDTPACYTFPFWWSYTQACRRLAKKTRLSMRQLDRGLWQYSKENQP